MKSHTICAAFLAPVPLLTHSLTPVTHIPCVVRLYRPLCTAELKPSVGAAKPTILPATQYVPLHVHSDYSLLDGASQLPALVKKAAELNVPALALTDHGVLYGAIQLVRACSSTNVKPIIGNEMYIVNDIPDQDQQPSKKGPKKYHLIVLAKNDIGYRNLVKLTTIAHLEGVIGKGIFARPCINKELLHRYRDGLVVSSACLGGEIAQAILNDDIDEARKVATWFRDTFHDDFYLEIQDHGSAEDKKVNPVMVQLSSELSIKVIATNDSHFTNCLDAEAHDALVCIQTGKMLTDEKRLRYSGTEYFKSVEEMRQCFVDHLPIHAVDEALYNTLEVAEKIEPYNLFGATRIPDYPLPDTFSSSNDDYLRHVSRIGLQDRLAARIKSGLVPSGSEEHYVRRLELELDMICRMGFSSYFLVVWDYIRYARSQKIPVGPGRGSVAGSVVAFALRITDVDPIPFNLLFERFLNPERKSMPDIDTDFSVEGRERVIAYVTKRYGHDRVAQIITFNRLTSKAVLKDVARVHSVSYNEADRLAKLIPVSRGKPATLTELLSERPPSRDFKNAIESTPSHREWLDKAQRIEGTNKTFGIHAAGVVISAKPLTDIVPLSRAKHGETITQYAMEDVESVGLLKMDFLGLKNLTIIAKALAFINKSRRYDGIQEEVDFSVDALPLNDAKTYKLLAEGELDGIFQLDASTGMRNVVRELRPSSLEDISSILALYRPGPLDAGLIPKFIRRKHGLEPIEYDHPLLEPILKETYGIMVYQEQIMRIARDLAGYSLGQADILRRAMGKKKMKDMEEERPRFVSGAKERGVTEKMATHLFDMMIKFAEYCFNKSHSTAYAYLTYQTAYLKANYPVEYSAAVLTSSMNQSDKLVRYLADARMLGVRVLPPSVNKSELGFTVHRDGENSEVLFGFEAVKTVGSSVSQALIDERRARGPFRSIIDLINRVNLRVLNKRAMAALIQAGAFDGLHPNRKTLSERFESLLTLRRKLRDKRKRQESKLKSEDAPKIVDESENLAWEEAEIEIARACEEETDFTALERLAGEKASIGFYASGHPLQDLQNVTALLGCNHVEHVNGESNDNEAKLNISDGSESLSSALANDSDVMVLSCVSELKKMTTSRGRKMARWMIEDAKGRVAGIVFPGFYEVIDQKWVPLETKGNSQLSATENLEPTTTGDTEPRFTVEEDARVVVWGTIDRESSGTVQVVVDDVQRVENVKAIVATANYNPERDPSDHLRALQNVVSEALGKTFSSYNTPKSGKDLQRRRWMKPKPLESKNRVPVVLHCLDDKGAIISAVNIGNSFRVSSDPGYIAEIKSGSGFSCRMVSVLEEFISTENNFGSGHNDGQNFTNEGDEERKAGSPEDKLPTRKFVSSRGSESYQPHSTKTVEGTGHALESKSTMNPELPAVLESEPPRTISKLSNSSLEKLGATGLVVPLHEGISQAPEKVSKRPPPRLFKDHGKRQEVLGSISETERGRTFGEEVFSIRQEMDDFAPSEAFLRFSQEEELPVLKASNNDENIRARLEANLQNEFTKQPKHFSPKHQTLLREREESLSVEGEAIIEAEPSPELPKEDTVSSLSPEIISETIDGETLSSSLSPDPSRIWTSPRSTTALSVNSKPPVDMLVFDISKGMSVVFDDVGFEGIIDAVCLVASTVAKSYCKSDFALAGMTGISLARLTESNVTVEVTGELSCAVETCLYISVSLRESRPSGQRKRSRSFGPVVVIVRTAEEHNSVSIVTAKSQKLIKTAIQKLEQSANQIGSVSSPVEESPLKSSKSLVKSSSTRQKVTNSYEKDSTKVTDGGQILCSLCRAALICIESAFSDAEELQVLSLEHVKISDPLHLLGTPTTLSVSTQIYDTMAQTGLVQVQGLFSNERGQDASINATFSVSCRNARKVFSRHVLNGELPLFPGQDIEAYFLHHAQGTSRYLKH